MSSLTSSGLLGALNTTSTTTTQSAYTTVWTTKVLAVNDFSTWEAVYTVTEVRTGDPTDYFRAAFPYETKTPMANDYSPCTHGPDVVVISPTAASDGADDSTATATAITSSSTDTTTPDDTDPVDADPVNATPSFTPLLDFHPDLAGGNIAPDGAAPFPTGEGTEFRSIDSTDEVMTVTTIQSVLPIKATAPASVDGARGGTDDPSGVTMEDILPLLSNLNLTNNGLNPSIVLVVPPTESGEVNDDVISVDDFDFDSDTGSAALRGAVSSSTDASETGPTSTVSAESSFTTVTISRTTSDDDANLRSAITSSTISDEDVSSTSTLDEETFTTTTTTATFSPSASASSAADEESGEETDETDAGPPEGFEKASNGEYIAIAAAHRVRAPTQSTTLLVINAMLVGLLLL